jgi:hypothetical protein
MAIADLDSIEDLIARLAETPTSLTRDHEISGALIRLADFNPALAAGLALESDLDSHFIVTAFQIWSEHDADASLAGLSLIGDSSMRVSVALGLLDVFGESEEAANRIATALPSGEIARFRLGWIKRRAAFNPSWALLNARAIDNENDRIRAIGAIAAVLVKEDPVAALTQSLVLEGSMRRQFREAVAYEWAKLDPAGFVSYAATGVLDSNVIRSGFRWVVAADANRALEFADGVSGNLGRSLQMVALSEMAATDPERALARVDEMPDGQVKNSIIDRVAVRFAENNPEGALLWAQNLNPPSEAIMNTVIQAIIQAENKRAAEYLVDAPPGTDISRVAQLIGALALSEAAGEVEMTANYLVAMDAPAARDALPGLLVAWLRRDEVAALEWLFLNATSVDTEVHARVARVLAYGDFRAAAGYVNRLPLEFRSDWIIEIVAPFAASDPNGAIDWLAQYQGYDVYDAAYREVVLEITRSGDIQSAASLLISASAAVQTGAAGRVARELAQKSPRDAARWAGQLVDQSAQVNAVDAVVSTWARTDFTAARRYTLGMETGAPRDRALLALVTQLASDGDYDSGLLAEFSTDQMREQSIGIAIPMIARNDPNTAWDLLDTIDANVELQRRIVERMAEYGIER